MGCLGSKETKPSGNANNGGGGKQVRFIAPFLFSSNPAFSSGAMGFMSILAFSASHCALENPELRDFVPELQNIVLP